MYTWLCLCTVTQVSRYVGRCHRQIKLKSERGSNVKDSVGPSPTSAFLHVGLEYVMNKNRTIDTTLTCMCEGKYL